MEEPPFQHHLDSIDHIQTFIIHFFRSETNREMAWRRRLDVTTSGAVFATGGMISFAFSSPDVSHIILLANVGLLCLFLLIESRRYRIYAKLKYRVRRIEEDYIAPLFNQIASEPKNFHYGPHVSPGLLDSLLTHQSPISRLEAAAWRLRRNYIYLYGVTYAIWLVKVFEEDRDQAWVGYVNQQAAVGSIPGLVVIIFFTLIILVALILTLYVPQISRENDY